MNKVLVKKISISQVLMVFIPACFVLCLYGVSQIDNDFIRYLLTIIVVCLYSVYLLVAKCRTLVLNVVYSCLFIYFLFTITNRYLIGKCAINYLYCIDVLCLLVMLKLVINKK